MTSVFLVDSALIVQYKLTIQISDSLYHNYVGIQDLCICFYFVFREELAWEVHKARNPEGDPLWPCIGLHLLASVLLQWGSPGSGPWERCHQGIHQDFYLSVPWVKCPNIMQIFQIGIPYVKTKCQLIIPNLSTDFQIWCH